MNDKQKNNAQVNKSDVDLTITNNLGGKMSHQQLLNNQFKKNALNARSFGGKRFLGLNKNGSEVWVSYVIQKETYELKISLTHSISSLLDEEAVLAERRITLKKGSQQHYSAQEMTRKNMKNAGGKVTKNTLTYLQKLISAVDSKNGIGYVDGKPTTSLFMMVSNFIFEGGVEPSNGDIRWRDVMEYWDLPKGSYFTLERFPIIEEDN